MIIKQTTAYLHGELILETAQVNDLHRKWLLYSIELYVQETVIKCLKQKLLQTAFDPSIG